ncbi:MAG: hypothetical protein AMS26_10730 [Bacteroides sp. SM23_62]|nr:MAG: hypothetical protein AMS26_10730 [Bacteroides sp. SM23_62]
MIAKYILVWFVLVIVAIINGIIRNEVYKDSLGDLHAHQLSTLTAIALFGLVIWGFTHLWKITSAQQAWAIGFIWLGMTILFEFIFGHFVMGHPWSRLLHDYNIFQGRVWILVLIWTTIAPYVFYKLSAK